MHEVFTVSWVLPLHLQETLDRLSPSCLMLKMSSWVTDERLSSFLIGNLSFPSPFQFKIHATDSSHKQYFAFVPSDIDTTSEIYKETDPNASRLKTGKSTGDKNVNKKERMCFCLFAYICYLTETTMCQKPRSRNWAIFIIKKKKLLSRLHSALNKKEFFPLSKGNKLLI